MWCEREKGVTREVLSELCSSAIFCHSMWLTRPSLDFGKQDWRIGHWSSQQSQGMSAGQCVLPQTRVFSGVMRERESMRKHGYNLLSRGCVLKTWFAGSRSHDTPLLRAFRLKVLRGVVCYIVLRSWGKCPLISAKHTLHLQRTEMSLDIFPLGCCDHSSFPLCFFN
jgi:hypothetical protein